MASKSEWCLIGMLLSILLTILGGNLNMTAITSNDCKMPVLVDNIYFHGTYTEHFLYTNINEVNNWQLTDIIKIDMIDVTGYFSIGDFMIFIGLLFVLIFASIYIILKFKVTKDG